MTDFTITSPLGQALWDWLDQDIYDNAETVAKLYQVLGTECDSLTTAWFGVLAQADVAEATWGLDDWERLLALTPNPSLTDPQRRSRILGRLQGVGTCTPALIQTLVSAYVPGETVLIEENQPAAYNLRITFAGAFGQPANLGDLQAAIRQVLPCHLTVSYVFTYPTWDQRDAADRTWTTVDALNRTYDQSDTNV